MLAGGTTESVGAITSDPTTNGDGAQVYAGNTTVGDGTSPASLTATQILQNTLTINAGSTVTIAPSAGAGGGVVAAASSAPAVSAIEHRVRRYRQRFRKRSVRGHPGCDRFGLDQQCQGPAT